jgi:predicted TIM-barrel fold metal-dependent hydrolase
MKIDVHCHCFPEPFMLRLEELGLGEVEMVTEGSGQKTAMWNGNPLPVWDTKQRLDEMRGHGVNMEALLLPLPYIGMGDHSLELCVLVNDFFAEVCHKHPDSFLAYAVAPINDAEAAIRELRRATGDLGLKAVLVPSHVDELYMSAPEFMPFWEEVDRLQIPVMMHPLNPPGQPFGAYTAMIGFPMETTTAATRLAYAGFFERHNIPLLLGHLGGAIPFMSRRLDFAYDTPAYRQKLCPDLATRPSQSFRKLFYETSLAYDDVALNCAISFAGIDHILFGSNYGSAAQRRGLEVRKVTLEFLESVKLSEADRELIFSGNARRLFGIG